MGYFGTHPDNAKKLGCALIFNNIYRELREETALINIFWLEILYIFVNSLASFEKAEYNDTTTVEQMRNAVKHLQRVFMEKASIFRKSDLKRRVPNDLNEGVLKDVALWLLHQTGNKNKYCRESCMELFLNITPLVTGQSTKLQTFIQQNLSGSVQNIFEKQLFAYPREDVNSSLDYSILIRWMKSFLCALDGYNFILINNLEDVAFNQSLFFTQLSFFLFKLQDIDIIGASNLIEVDRDVFFDLKCSCILAVLRLYSTVVHNDFLLKKANSLWHDGFWMLIGNLIFKPHLVQMDPILRPKFEEILNNLMKGLSSKLPEIHMKELSKFLRTYLCDREIVIKNFNVNVNSYDRSLVQGLMRLSHFQIHQEMTSTLNHFSDEIINKLMANFYKNIINDEIMLEFSPTTFAYTESILKFTLLNKKELNSFLKYLFAPYVVRNMEYNGVCFGIYILSCFSDIVVPFIINDFDTFLEIALNCGDIVKTIDLLIYILKYLVKEKILTQKYNDILFCLMKHWNIFENYFNSSSSHLEKGIEYVKLLVQFPLSNQRDLHQWLISCLNKENERYSFEIFELLVLTTNEELGNTR